MNVWELVLNRHKKNNVIKGINLEGLRKIGDPVNIAKEYYTNGIDELLIIDSVASYMDEITYWFN